MRTLAAALLVLALAGCATPASSEVDEEPPVHELAVEQLSPLDGVVEVRARPSDEALDLGVIMVAEVTREQLAAAAIATREFMLEHADVTGSHARVTVVPVELDTDPDTPPVAPLVLELYPSLRTTPSEDARQLHDASQLAGVTRATIVANAVSIDVAHAADLGPALDGLRALDLWSNGGAVWAELGRVRIMDVPDRLTNNGMRVILQLAVAYPAAQFWLEAPKTGEQWPRLYVDQATADEAAAIAAALGEPMPEPTVNDLDVDFVVSWVDGDGRHDLTGVLGTRVD